MAWRLTSLSGEIQLGLTVKDKGQRSRHGLDDTLAGPFPVFLSGLREALAVPQRRSINE